MIQEARGKVFNSWGLLTRWVVAKRLAMAHKVPPLSSESFPKGSLDEAHVLCLGSVARSSRMITHVRHKHIHTHMCVYIYYAHAHIIRICVIMYTYVYVLYVGTCTDMYWQGLDSVFVSSLKICTQRTGPKVHKQKVSNISLQLLIALVRKIDFLESSWQSDAICQFFPTVQVTSPRLNEQMTPRALFEMVKDDQNWAAQMQCKFA